MLAKESSSSTSSWLVLETRERKKIVCRDESLQKLLHGLLLKSEALKEGGGFSFRGLRCGARFGGNLQFDKLKCCLLVDD